MSTTNAKVISLIKSKPIELLDSSVTTIQYYKMTSNQSTKGQALLEEWPSSPRQHLLEAWPTVESPRPKEKKRVRIGEYSEVRIFNNRSYISKKSYSKDDVDMFKAQIAIEARSLQNLISRFGSSTGSAIHSALDLGMLQIESLVGMEHLVSTSARDQFVLERKTHSAVVLRAQKLLQEKHDYSDEIASVMLAKAASISSSDSAKKAGLRAAMSLKAPSGTVKTGIVIRKHSTGSGSSSSKSFKKNDESSFAHLRVPSMDSVKLARAHAARTIVCKSNATWAA
jgi:hypothetical protein